MKKFINKYIELVKNRLQNDINNDDETIVLWQAKFFTNVVIFLLPFSFILYIPSLIMSLKDNLNVIATFDTLAFLGLLFITFNKSISLNSRKIIFTSIFYILGLILLYFMGWDGPGLLYITMTSVLASVLISTRQAYWYFASNILVLLIVALNSQINFLGNNQLTKLLPEAVITIGLNYLMFNVVVIIAISSLIKGLKLKIETEKMMSLALKHETENLNIAKKSSEESEARFKNLMQNINSISIQSYSPKGETLYWNKASEMIYGYSEKEAIGKNLLDLIIPDEIKSNVSEAIKFMAETGTPIPSSELILRHKDGSKVAVYSSHHILNIPGKEQELFRIDIDLSKLKQAEEHIQKLSLAIENSKEVVFITDLNGIIIYTNPEFSKMYGFTKEEVIGKVTPRILKSGLTSIEASQYLWQTLLNKKRIFGEYINKTKDGRFISIEGSADPILNDDGEIIGFLGIHRDITQRKKTESELIESRANLRAIIENTNDSIWSVNTNFELIYINDVFKTAFKYNYGIELLPGMNILDPVPSEIRNDWKEKYSRAFANEKLLFEQMFDFDDFKMYVEVAINPILVGDKVIGASVFSRDITDRKIYEKRILNINEELENKVDERTEELQNTLIKLQETNIELQLLNNQVINDKNQILLLNEDLMVSQNKLKETLASKDKFFSIIAHDLRNPFVTLLNNSELLEKFYYNMNDDEKIKLISQIKSSSNSTFNLLNTLLNWAASQMGKIEFMPKKMSLSELVNKVILILRQQAEKKSIFIENEIIENKIIYADPELLNTVFRNLISNAIKFTPENGKILIGCKEISSEYSNFEECIYIKDNGVGISKETINYLFRLDTQITTSGTNGEKGSGLGLLLCKEFIEMHKGVIWVESELGKGSTFSFALPNIN